MAGVEQIDDRTFAAFAAIIYAKCGIVISEQKRSLLQARLSKRMRVIKISSFADYLDLVENDREGNEIAALLDAISTNVTHFFREAGHFDFLASVLSQWEKDDNPRIRIWCAASSTGEEPYSIAITVREALSRSDLDIRILATDICTSVIEDARKGIYPPGRVDNVSRHLLDRYFLRVALGHDEKGFQAKSSIRDLIKFGRLNLVQTPYPLQGPLDVIFCRNVMIYFDNPIRRRVISEFLRLLSPGGYLIVGHAESLTGTLTSELKSIAPAIYQKI